MLGLFVESGAEFSDCGTFRYTLWRRWDDALPTIVFAMLNPSTATAEVSDPTVTRCLRRAQRWGYGRLIVVNAFAYRSTDPDALRQRSAPLEVIGPGNDAAISWAEDQAQTLVAAWGTDGNLYGRGRQVIDRLTKPVMCLGQNKDGSPKHPLYVGYGVGLQPMRV